MTAYAHAAVNGKILAGRAVRLAGERHLRDLREGKRRGLRWAPGLARKAIAFFPRFLRLVEGVHADQPFILEPFQKFIVGSLFGWLGRDGFRRFRHAYIEIAKGGGKALALDTPIPTPAGWTTIGALRVGDEVFDETGRPATVEVVTEPMLNRPCYRIRFSDGAEIVTDAEHLWETTALRNGGRRGPKPLTAPRKGQAAVRTTREIAATLRMPESRSQHPQALWNHRVALAGSLELPERDLPIPPYTLGAWLGDGESSTNRLTVPPEKRAILEYIRAEGITAEWQDGDRALLGRGHLRSALRNASLLENKHIPAPYLRASRRQRLALLAGLMDTDGSCSGGKCEHSTTSPALARGVVELLRTLGFKPGLIECRARLYGRDCGPAFRIQFSAYRGELEVFRLEHKAARLPVRPVTRPISRGRMIIACDAIPSVPVACIKVAAPSGLFLAGQHMVPTHNSPLLAGLMLYALVLDDEAGAEIYAAAVTRDQAKIVFSDAAKMARASVLAKHLVIGENNIAYDAMRSFIRPVSSEARSLDGKRVHCAGIDELHEHQTSLVTDKMQAGTKGRRQPLVVEITNAGYDRQSVCWQHHAYALKILEGAVENDAWFAYVCQLDACDPCRADGAMQPRDECSRCDDWRDERAWIKANPGLGQIVTAKYLREQIKAATGMPAKESLVRRLNFCHWTESHSRWLDMEAWHACAGEIGDAELLGRPCFAAFDLGQSDDFSALAMIWKLETDRVAIRMRYWLPAVALGAKPGRPYDAWQRAGRLTVTEGDITDYDLVEREILEAARAGGAHEVAYDKRFAAQMALHLEGAGLTVVDVPQGYALNEALRAIHDLVKTRQLVHDGDPILAWMAANAVARHGTRGEIRLDKEKAQDKIDGVAALAMAVDRMLRHDATGGWRPL